MWSRRKMHAIWKGRRALFGFRGFLHAGGEAAPIWWTPKFDVESRESRNEETQQTVLGAVQEGRRSPA